MRRLSRRGVAEAEVVGVGQLPEDDGDDRRLLVPLMKDGDVVDWGSMTLEAARARHASSRAELPPAAHRLQRGEPAIPTQFVPAAEPL
jgi:nicotinate phosphoribosyltransferase